MPQVPLPAVPESSRHGRRAEEELCFSLWRGHLLQIKNFLSCRNKLVINCPNSSPLWRYVKKHQQIFTVCWARYPKLLIMWHHFVTPMLTRETAALLKQTIIPVLSLPQGTAYELIRCQQRCHIFIHSIFPLEKTKAMEEMIERMNLVCVGRRHL